MKLCEVIQGTEVSEPIQVGMLQVAGLRWPMESGLGYALFDDAVAKGKLIVREISESGSVPEIELVNESDELILLMAGQVLAGAKQNRTLNVSMLAPPQRRSRVPVSCVEQGRWGYRSRRFGSSGKSSHSALRAMMSRQSSAAYRRQGKPRADQHEVWREVDRVLLKTGSSSRTASVLDAYAHVQKNVDEMIKSVHLPADCSGAAFAIGGKVVGVDLFDKPATFHRLLPTLLFAYAVDAMCCPVTEPRVECEAIRSWLQAATEAAFEPYASPGVGRDVRIEGKSVIGAALCHDETVIHLELFARDRNA